LQKIDTTVHRKRYLYQLLVLAIVAGWW